MLYLSYINPTGMFSYCRSENISLSSNNLIHLVGINEDKGGCSNGAGKTSLFNSICEIIFGENPTNISGAGAVNSTWGRGCCGRIEFVSWENVYYRVTYCRDWKEGEFYPIDNDNKTSYKGTALFLDKWDGKQWVDDCDRGMRQTRDRIIKAIGLSYNRFLAISYMSHRVGNRFLRGTNKVREDILAGITGVEEWDHVISTCRTESKSLIDKKSPLLNKINFIEGEKSALSDQLFTLNNTNWNHFIETTKINLETAKVQKHKILTNIEKKYQLLKDFQDMKDKININSDKLKSIDNNLNKLTTKHDSLMNEQFITEILPIELKEQFDSINKNVNTFRGELNVMTSKNSKFLEIDKCPMCNSKISKAKKDKILKDTNKIKENLYFYEDELDRVTAQINNYHTSQKIVVKDKISIRDKEAVKLREQINKYTDEKFEIFRKKDELASSINIANHDKQALEVDLANCENTIKQNEELIISARKQISSINELENKILEKETDIQAYFSEIKIIDDDLVIINWLISHIPYIKLHKLSMSMVVLSNKINEYLSSMGNTTRINISSFKEKQKTKGTADLSELLKSEIVIDIQDGEKNIDPRLYSDGEIGALSNAVIRALHDLAINFGHGCNLQMMDEVFSFIDNDNGQKIAESFSNTNNGTTIITDNSGKASGLINFDETWTARKRNNQTILEMNHE